MELRFLRYQEPYQEAILALHRSAGMLGIDAGSLPAGEEADLTAIEDAYLGSGGEFLAGFLGDRFIAMGGFKRVTPVRAELKRMRIAVDRQGKGYGTRLLRELERRARAMGYRTLCLETAKDRPLTLRFYEKHGYRRTGEGVYGRVETVRFEKALNDPTGREGTSPRID